MNMRAVKRTLMIVLPLLFAIALFVYIKEYNPFHKEGQNSFTETADGIIVDASGIEYTFLSPENWLGLRELPFDNLIFEGSIAGEPDTLRHLGLSRPTGMYSIRGDRTFDILIRYRHDSEWYSIYRKSSLPPLDSSSDNLNRLIFVDSYLSEVFSPILGNIIVDPQEIAEFLSDVRSQKIPQDAGLYDLIRLPNGSLQNCYKCGVIYGYFEEEPNVCIRMGITSYNDLAYSVSIEGRDYVLPDQWAERLGVH